jgi:hypothetical protein
MQGLIKTIVETFAPRRFESVHKNPMTFLLLHHKISKGGARKGTSMAFLFLHPPVGVKPYGVKPYGVKPYGVKPYGVGSPVGG